MTQTKRTIQGMNHPVFISPLSRKHLHHPQGHILHPKRHKSLHETKPLRVKQSLVEQALKLADEMPPLPDGWDYKKALADAIQQRHGEA